MSWNNYPIGGMSGQTLYYQNTPTRQIVQANTHSNSQVLMQPRPITGQMSMASPMAAPTAPFLPHIIGNTIARNISLANSIGETIPSSIQNATICGSTASHSNATSHDLNNSSPSIALCNANKSSNSQPTTTGTTDSNSATSPIITDTSPNNPGSNPNNAGTCPNIPTTKPNTTTTNQGTAGTHTSRSKSTVSKATSSSTSRSKSGRNIIGRVRFYCSPSTNLATNWTPNIPLTITRPHFSRARVNSPRTPPAPQRAQMHPPQAATSMQILPRQMVVSPISHEQSTRPQMPFSHSHHQHPPQVLPLVPIQSSPWMFHHPCSDPYFIESNPLAAPPPESVSLVQRPSVVHETCPVLKGRLSLKTFFCGVPTHIDEEALKSYLSDFKICDVTRYRNEDSWTPGDIYKDPRNSFHVVFEDVSMLELFISRCFQCPSSGECFFPILCPSLGEQVFQVVPWQAPVDEVWRSERTCNLEDAKMVSIENVCGNMTAPKLAKILATEFGPIDICQVHLTECDTTFYPTGTGMIVFVRAVDRDYAVRTGKIRVYTSCHSSTLYIKPHTRVRYQPVKF